MQSRRDTSPPLSAPPSNSLRNEQLWFMQILNQMYNDNIRHIDQHHQHIQQLQQTNTQLLEHVQHMLNPPTPSPSPAPAPAPSPASHPHLFHNPSPHPSTNTTPPMQETVFVEEFVMPVNLLQQMLTTLRNLGMIVAHEETSPPTDVDIQRAVRRVSYGTIPNPVSTSCAISMETFQPDDTVSMIRHCGHCFREEALRRWFQQHATCPVCRHNIRSVPSAESVEG